MLIGDVEQLSLEANDTEDNETDHLYFFRTCVVESNLSALKERMSKTIALREKVIKQKNTIFFKCFPFYFCQPDLVYTYIIFYNA